MPDYRLHMSKRQEEFSIAWLHAISAAAGFSFETKRVDVDGIDATISQKSEGKSRAIYEDIKVQLKCTHAHSPTGQTLTFPLKAINYNLLSGKRIIPRILVVLHVPEKIDEWLTHSTDKLVLRNCAYWTSLHNKAPTDNKTSVSVPIPINQRLTVSELVRMMDLAAKGKFEEVLKI